MTTTRVISATQADPHTGVTTGNTIYFGVGSIIKILPHGTGSEVWLASPGAEGFGKTVEYTTDSPSTLQTAANLNP